MVNLAGFGGNTVTILITAVDQASATLNRTKASLASFQTKGLAAGAAGLAIGYGLVKAGKAAAVVEKGFRDINSIMPKGFDAQKTFGDQVQKNTIALGDMGNESTVLTGYYQTMSSGFTDAADATNVMNASVKAAVAGQAQLPDVILLLSKTLHSYGLSTQDATKVTDIFQATVNTGITTWPQLAHAFPTVAGSAAAAKIPLQETAGTLAMLTKTMGNTDEATTALNSIILAFLKPSSDMKKAVEELGYSSAASMLQQNGLAKSLELLKTKTNGDAAATSKLFANKRALRGVLPLLNDATGEYAKTLASVNNTTGLTNRAFEDQQGTSYTLAQASNELKLAFADFGQTMLTTLGPILKWITNIIRKLTSWFKKLPGPVKQAIVIFMSVAAVLGILAGVIALVTLVSSPWLLIIIAIIAAITAIIMVILNWKKILIAFLKLMGKVGIFMQGVWISFKDFWIVLWSQIKNIYDKIWNKIVKGLENNVNHMIKILNTLIKGINAVSGAVGIGKIGLIGNVNFGGAMKQLTDINALKNKLATEKASELALARSGVDQMIGQISKNIGIDKVNNKTAEPKNNINVHIDNLNATDAQSVSTGLVNELKNKISI